ncbi:MAG: hypothetical protein ACI8RD_007374, partial [Bacillariaceae sp.]
LRTSLKQRERERERESNDRVSSRKVKRPQKVL